MVNSRQVSRTVWSIVLVLLLVLATYMYLGTTLKVELTDSSVKVAGIYGSEIGYADILSVEELDRLPIAGTRTNGIGLGFMNVGHFSFPVLGKVILYQLRTEAPYILVKTRDRQVVYGFGRERDKAILDRIRQEMARAR